MTDKLNSIRGYDDSPYLKEMADGIIVRRFASVEDAAKSVLGEDSGSNVDRLRRKFREQNWYTRGLNEYVEAEINRRGVEFDAPKRDPWYVDGRGQPMSDFDIKIVKGCLAVVRQFTPTGLLAFGGVAFSALLVALYMRGMDFKEAIAALIGVSGSGLCLWAFKAGWKSTRKEMGVRLTTIIGFILAMIFAMRVTVPDPRYHTGSMPGSALIAVGVLATAAFLIAYTIRYAERVGRRKAPEFMALSSALLFGSVLGFNPIMSDWNGNLMRNEMTTDASSSISQAIVELKKTSPGADLAPLQSVQRKMLERETADPTWSSPPPLPAQQCSLQDDRRNPCTR